MKTYCKNIDVADPHNIVGPIRLCFAGKLHEPEFVKLLCEVGGADPATISTRIALDNPDEFSKEYLEIAKEISRRISNRDLELAPIAYFWHRDGREGKLRLLGKETAIHQCMDYVAVEFLMPLFDAKIMTMQCASVPGRGQVYGKQLLEKWVQKQADRNRIYIQTDVKQCYKSLSPDTVMKLLRRDIGKNKTLLWFVDMLLSMFEHGLSIGSYLSQWLCNYALSYACHYLHERCFKERRHRDGSVEKVRLFSHAVMYMDDFIITGTSKRDLKMCVRKLDKYLRTFLGLEFKPGWSAKYTDREPIDSMGFCVGSEATTIRGRVFLRARRALVKAWGYVNQHKRIPLGLAQRVVSYAGWFIHSNSKKASEKYHLTAIAALSKKIVSMEGKYESYKNKLRGSAGASGLPSAPGLCMG